MVKATVVLVVGGLMGSGIAALTGSFNEAQPNVIARQEPAVPSGAITTQSNSPEETNQLGYIQARFAVQRPFAALCAVSR